jgi:hypothetical protein
MAIETDKKLDPKLKAHPNKYIDQRIIEASRQVCDSLNKKIKAVDTTVHRAEFKANKNRCVIISSKGARDMAYPPLLLSTGARSIGIEV